MKNKGFTLIELIAALGILGVLLAVVASILINSSFTLNKETKEASAQDMVRRTLRLLEEDIRRSDYVSKEFVDSSNAPVVLTIPNLIAPVVYFENNTDTGIEGYMYVLIDNSGRKELHKVEAKTPYKDVLIITNISDITVDYAPKAMSKILMIKLDMVDKGAVRSFSTTVSVRNGG